MRGDVDAARAEAAFVVASSVEDARAAAVKKAGLAASHARLKRR